MEYSAGMLLKNESIVYFLFFIEKKYRKPKRSVAKGKEKPLPSQMERRNRFFFTVPAQPTRERCGTYEAMVRLVPIVLQQGTRSCFP
jgi:hypothetical protein